MSLDFPVAPVSGATHVQAGLSWRWLSPRWVAASIVSPDLLPPANLTVTAGQVLPAGFTGTVLVQAAAPLIVTLPPGPTLGQAVTVKDALGNSSTHAITVSGGAALIEGEPTVVINFNYGWVALVYGGVEWLQI